MITIAPNNPPLTAREALQLLFGEPHAGGGKHGVSIWCTRKILGEDDKKHDVIFLRCACGKVFRIDDVLCAEKKTYLHVVEEALCNAPSAASWGEI